VKCDDFDQCWKCPLDKTGCYTLDMDAAFCKKCGKLKTEDVK